MVSGFRITLIVFLFVNQSPIRRSAATRSGRPDAAGIGPVWLCGNTFCKVEVYGFSIAMENLII